MNLTRDLKVRPTSLGKTRKPGVGVKPGNGSGLRAGCSSESMGGDLLVKF